MINKCTKIDKMVNRVRILEIQFCVPQRLDDLQFWADPLAAFEDGAPAAEVASRNSAQ